MGRKRKVAVFSSPPSCIPARTLECLCFAVAVVVTSATRCCLSFTARRPPPPPRSSVSPEEALKWHRHVLCRPTSFRRFFIGTGRRRSDALRRVGNRCAENLPSACGIRDLASVLFSVSLPPRSSIYVLVQGVGAGVFPGVSARTHALNSDDVALAYGGCAGFPS